MFDKCSKFLRLAEFAHGQYRATCLRNNPVGSRSEMVSRTNQRAGSPDTHYDQVRLLFLGSLQDAIGRPSSSRG